jgi:hypothetical protein
MHMYKICIIPFFLEFFFSESHCLFFSLPSTSAILISYAVIASIEFTSRYRHTPVKYTSSSYSSLALKTWNNFRLLPIRYFWDLARLPVYPSWNLKPTAKLGVLGLTWPRLEALPGLVLTTHPDNASATSPLRKKHHAYILYTFLKPLPLAHWEASCAVQIHVHLIDGSQQRLKILDFFH